MDLFDLIESTINILAQYRCRHLSWADACKELADLGLGLEAIKNLIEYEDRKD